MKLEDLGIVPEHEEFKFMTIIREIDEFTDRLQFIYHNGLSGNVMEAFELEDKISKLKLELTKENSNCPF